LNLKTKALAKQARILRKMHKYFAIPLVLFMLILGITGLLLTWKSQLQLTPPSQKVTISHKPLISLSQISENAIKYIDSLKLDNTINRIDYRPSKGIAKVRFENHFTELQIDCYTGNIISVKHRTSDVIEMIHDGSIIDYLFKSSSENAKLAYSTLTSLGLMLLAFSGFFMWLRSRQIKRIKKKDSLTSH